LATLTTGIPPGVRPKYSRHEFPGLLASAESPFRVLAFSCFLNEDGTATLELSL